jgi:ADP-L-glycero-D-manno-heptose 6-epimerase
MIVVTGAAGFIGSCLVNKLNNKGIREIVVVDDFSNPLKNKNLENKAIQERVHRNDFFKWIDENHKEIKFIFHLGARTDTTEFNKEIFDELNLNYSKQVWNACVDHNLPLVYASSAATYGMGEHGYSDRHDLVEKLKPLNPYGESKNEFDKWVLKQKKAPFYWVGVKFFNVFGPNEYHKGRMASVVYHAFKQIQETGKVKLFRSHNPDYKDGGQLRDFVYVKDVIDILLLGMMYQKNGGIFNIGTGKARTFLDLAKAVFHAMGKPEKIEFIDTPADIRDKYQYFTQADITKLLSLDYNVPFYSLEKGIEDYVQGYLMSGLYY